MANLAHHGIDFGGIYLQGRLLKVIVHGLLYFCTVGKNPVVQNSEALFSFGGLLCTKFNCLHLLALKDPGDLFG